MARIVTTARGEELDFDAFLIKQQLAQAPMNIEVERRKKFIDSKEGKMPKTAAPAAVEPPANEFEVDNEPPKAKKK